MMFEDPEEARRFLEGIQRHADTILSGRELSKAGVQGQKVSMQSPDLGSVAKASLMTKGKAGEVVDTLGVQAQDPDLKRRVSRLEQAADRLRAQKDTATKVGLGIAGGVGTALSPSRLPYVPPTHIPDPEANEPNNPGAQ